MGGVRVCAMGGGRGACGAAGGLAGGPRGGRGEGLGDWGRDWELMVSQGLLQCEKRPKGFFFLGYFNLCLTI